MDFKNFKTKYEKEAVEEFPNKAKDAPMVSVCVQTYQHANYIRECLDGILMQETDFTFEILLGEDNSTDGTREICLEYAKKFPKKIRLFLHHRENNIKVGGFPTGRFNLLYNFYSARGKYIALCEGDDFWTDPYKLQKQIDFLEANDDFSLCFHNAQIKFADQRQGYIFRALEKREYLGGEILRDWIIPTASVVFRRIALDYSLLLNKNFIFGDIILFLSMAESGKLWCIDEIMSIYNIHSDGMSSKNNSHLTKKRLLIRHQEEINKNFGGKYSLIQEEKLSKLYIHLSKMELGKFETSFLMSLIKAFAIQPKIFLANLMRVYLNR